MPQPGLERERGSLGEAHGPCDASARLSAAFSTKLPSAHVSPLPLPASSSSARYFLKCIDSPGTDSSLSPAVST